jgi:serine/threonine protein kinase
MEYCGGGIIDKEKMKKDLMENLKIMHSLGIVHMDIKPENIGWSNEFKKWVFLDFGLAHFLDAKIG